MRAILWCEWNLFNVIPGEKKKINLKLYEQIENTATLESFSPQSSGCVLAVTSVSAQVWELPLPNTPRQSWDTARHSTNSPAQKDCLHSKHKQTNKKEPPFTYGGLIYSYVK